MKQYGVRELSQLLSRSIRQIHRYREDGKFPTASIGKFRKLYWDEREVEWILKQFKIIDDSIDDVAEFIELTLANANKKKRGRKPRKK